MDKNRPEPEKSFYLTMNLVKAFIISRPNRFCLICRIEKSNEPIRAYLPNPGRMKELVFPGVTVLLQQNNPTPLMDRKTTHTAVFLIKNNSVYLIHSAMANDLVQTLINKEMISSLKNYTIERREFCLKNILENKSTLTEPKSSASKNISSASKNKRSGTEKKPPQSRIDFLLSGKNSSKKALLEVKNCNFLVNKTALFPDAPSIRASRHLIDLQACSEKADFEIFSLILITGSRAEKFCPNFNTDPLFSKTCFELSKEQGGNLLHIPIYLDIQFSGPDTKEQEYTFKLTPFQAYFDRELLQDRLNDSGSYVIFAEIKNEVSINAGKLGCVKLMPGWYLYAGSAMKNLEARINRHLRKKKKFHWHIDYLLDRADSKKALLFRDSKKMECHLARFLQKRALSQVPGFGSSDCKCRSHLFYFKENPLAHMKFTDQLLAFGFNSG